MPNSRQLKIGLSNADKTAMATQVATQTLDKVINGPIIIDGEETSVKEKVQEINDALDRESLKANVDGNYPTMTVGLADNLTPYSEDSGAEQTNPFISNGTGTNNNTEIVTVGDYGLLKEKQGNTVVANQLARELNSNYWAASNATVSFSEGVATFTASDTNGRIRLVTSYRVQYYANHKYLMVATIKGTTNNASAGMILNDGTDNILQITLSTSYQTFSFIATLSNTTSAGQINIIDKRSSDWDAIQVKNVQLIDLTQMFNGDIPQDLLDNPEHFSWYYNGSLAYNTGSLENANGVKLVSTGRNLWDEEWELGAYNTTTGEKDNATTSQIRCKNHILVVPNKTYYSFCGTYDGYLKPLFYDENDNYIGTVSSVYNSTFTTPSNCCYIRFYMNLTYGTTYNHDITISLYYTPEQGGEGYNQYYPYEEPYEVDTGSEVLRKAGSVKDYKEPNGTIHRLVGSVDLGTLDWTYTSGQYRSEGIMSLVKKPTSSTETVNAIVSNGKYNISYDTHGQQMDMYVGTSGALYLRDSSQTGTPTGTLYFELETPTTEQGTSFSTNLLINDYGMLYWLDSSDNLVGIPQGAKIFYPTNYKGFVDDMYSRVDGDSSAYVVQSELSAEETARSNQDTILQNAIGGTLRQCLCVKETLDFEDTDFVDLGTLSWQLDNVSYGNPYFLVSNSNIKAPVDNNTPFNGLCSKYKTASWNTLGGSSGNLTICYASGQIRIKDTSYNDAVAFKNAMKGVLLAYEKAEE